MWLVGEHCRTVDMTCGISDNNLDSMLSLCYVCYTVQCTLNTAHVNCATKNAYYTLYTYSIQYFFKLKKIFFGFFESNFFFNLLVFNQTLLFSALRTVYVVRPVRKSLEFKNLILVIRI